MSKKTTTKSKNTPWAPAEPYIKGALGGLQTANQQGQANLAGSMPVLNQAIAKIGQNIATPPQYATDARTQLGKTINGDFVNSNPHTGAIADLIAQKTGAQYNSTFGAAGRSNGGLAALLSSQGIGDALQSFYGDQYNRERGMQQQAIMAAPAFRADEYTDLNALLPAMQSSALLPGQVAGQYAGGVTNVTSPYVQNTTTQKQGGLGNILATGLGLAAQIGGAAMTGGASLGMSGLLQGMGGGIAAGGAVPSGFGRWLG